MVFGGSWPIARAPSARTAPAAQPHLAALPSGNEGGGWLHDRHPPTSFGTGSRWLSRRFLVVVVGGEHAVLIRCEPQRRRRGPLLQLLRRRHHRRGWRRRRLLRLWFGLGELLRRLHLFELPLGGVLIRVRLAAVECDDDAADDAAAVGGLDLGRRAEAARRVEDAFADGEDLLELPLRRILVRVRLETPVAEVEGDDGEVGFDLLHVARAAHRVSDAIANNEVAHRRRARLPLAPARQAAEAAASAERARPAEVAGRRAVSGRFARLS